MRIFFTTSQIIIITLCFMAVAGATAGHAQTCGATGPWAGFYAGAHVGGAWGETEYSGGGDKVSMDQDGVVVGGHLGYNVQCGQILFGIEGDATWRDGEDDIRDDTVTLSTSSDWLASIRGRLGYVMNNLLLYATAGVAFTDSDFSLVDTDPGFETSFSSSTSMTGYVVGGGAELKFSQNLSGRLEVLHYGFGDEKLSFPDGQIDSDLDATVVRLGASFHLN